MSWWDAWKHALSHPSDNVVAATIVLAGVVITAAVSLVSSSLSRKHERQKLLDDRVFPVRAAAYSEARNFMITAPDKDFDYLQDDAVYERSGELGTKLTLYGTQKSVDLFWNWADQIEIALDLTRDKSDEERASALVEAEVIRKKFQAVARQDIQGRRWKNRAVKKS